MPENGRSHLSLDNRQKFADLYLAHSTSLANTLRRRFSATPEDAEDTVIGAFLNLMRSYGQIQNKQLSGGLALVATSNEYRDRVLRRTWPQSLEAFLDNGEPTTFIELFASEDDTEKEAINLIFDSETYELILKIREYLLTKYQNSGRRMFAIFTFLFSGGVTNDEIARILDIPERNVKMYIRRTRNAIASFLIQEYGEEKVLEMSEGRSRRISGSNRRAK